MGKTVTTIDGISDLAEWVAKNQSELRGMVVLAINKKGEPLLRTSLLNMGEKAFLAQFYSGWIQDWFFSSEGGE